jgi:hypothetical protein
MNPIPTVVGRLLAGLVVVFARPLIRLIDWDIWEKR